MIQAHQILYCQNHDYNQIRAYYEMEFFWSFYKLYKPTQLPTLH